MTQIMNDTLDLELVALVDKARQGDRMAYGAIVERFQGYVFSLAMNRLRDLGEAQELTQEVFIHAMVKLDQLRDARCFTAWLRQITVRKAINRRARKPPVYSTDGETLGNLTASPAPPMERLIQDEQEAELRGGLVRLEPMDRATLEAHYLGGRSVQQMSRDFKAPVGTIKRRLHVARNRLRKLLESKRLAAV